MCIKFSNSASNSLVIDRGQTNKLFWIFDIDEWNCFIEIVIVEINYLDIKK